MTDLPESSRRRYSEKEVAQIIKRASEMQEDDAPTHPASGLSLAELEQVAREAGLDPNMVRVAARDLDARVTDEPSSRFLGAPSSLCLERTIDGEIPSDEFEVLVRDIQHVLNEMGTATTLGRSLQWNSSRSSRRRADTRSVQIIVAPRHGRTTIRIEEQLRWLASGMFAGLVGGVGGGMMIPVSVAAASAIAASGGAALAAAGAVSMGAGALAGAYLLARSLYGRVTRRRGKGLQELMTRLVAHVEATAVRVPSMNSASERGKLESGG